MKTLEVGELTEHINEILRMVEEEGETIELTKHREVVAHLVPTPRPGQTVKRDLTAFWAEIDRLAAAIGSYLPEQVDVVEIMRDIRRDL